MVLTTFLLYSFLVAFPFPDFGSQIPFDKEPSSTAKFVSSNYQILI